MKMRKAMCGMISGCPSQASANRPASERKRTKKIPVDHQKGRFLQCVAQKRMGRRGGAFSS